MNQKLNQIALLVKEYNEAIEFYTKKIGFVLVEDTILSDTKRWVVVKPIGEGSCTILLAKASTEVQEKSIGNQTGGRVFLFLHTDNIERDYKNLLQNNVTIIREPSSEVYGTVLVFADLYGNLWDLIEPLVH
jgi:catechol 2,3-dioxygenase-like lactoylglutathione lyase family enzyme